MKLPPYTEESEKGTLASKSNTSRTDTTQGRKNQPDIHYRAEDLPPTKSDPHFTTAKRRPAEAAVTMETVAPDSYNVQRWTSWPYHVEIFHCHVITQIFMAKAGSRPHTCAHTNIPAPCHQGDFFLRISLHVRGDKWMG